VSSELDEFGLIKFYAAGGSSGVSLSWFSEQTPQMYREVCWRKIEKDSVSFTIND